ncbi:MAG: helix-turn-helix domain-containing protein [Oscillospiraceae bacterium]|nr:helix-turn-helix domain-containing protein [Oscillospiraceae bacterium]
MNLPTYQSNDELPLVMNVKDVAGYLHISTTCAYTLMNAESFPALKIGKRILI